MAKPSVRKTAMKQWLGNLPRQLLTGKSPSYRRLVFEERLRRGELEWQKLNAKQQRVETALDRTLNKQQQYWASEINKVHERLKELFAKSKPKQQGIKHPPKKGLLSRMTSLGRPGWGRALTSVILSRMTSRLKPRKEEAPKAARIQLSPGEQLRITHEIDKLYERRRFLRKRFLGSLSDEQKKIGKPEGEIEIFLKKAGNKMNWTF